jgi:hypothetical protein
MGVLMESAEEFCLTPVKSGSPPPLFTGVARAGMLDTPAVKLICRGAAKIQPTIKIMGDRSPKSNQKKSSQKQAQASSAENKKQQAIAAKQSVGKKN